MTNRIPSRRRWLGLGGTGLFLGLFFWRTDLGELGDALAQANYWWVVPAVAFWFVSATVRSPPLRYLLARLAELPPRPIGIPPAFALLLALFAYVASPPEIARRCTERAKGLLPSA